MEKIKKFITITIDMSDIIKQYLQKQQDLLDNIKADLPRLEHMLETYSSPGGYEDHIYRFYCESFKVYSLQMATKQIVDNLRNLSPNEDKKLDSYFEKIIQEGTSGKKWELKHNKDWYHQTVPFVNAFFHAKFFLEMAVKYGHELEEAPKPRPYGWAALLSLYNIK
jgi:hypothetical protein